MSPYLSLSWASEHNSLIVQLQNLAKALITVFKAMSKDHRADDVTHSINYGELGAEWSSWEHIESNSSYNEYYIFI